MTKVRQVTNRILDAVNDGSMDAEIVLNMCLQYMSEAEVADMAWSNDLFPEEDED